MLVKGITSPSRSLDISSPIIDMRFIQNNQVMNLASIHESNQFIVTSLRTFQTVFELNLSFIPSELALDPKKNLMLITGRDEIKDKQIVDKINENDSDF